MRGTDRSELPVCVSLFTFVCRSPGSGRGVGCGKAVLGGSGFSTSFSDTGDSRDFRSGATIAGASSPSRGTARPRARNDDGELEGSDAIPDAEDEGRMARNSVASSSSLECMGRDAPFEAVCGGAFGAGPEGADVGRAVFDGSA